MRCSVAIIGGGLSGLRCAHLLAERGVDFVLLEARSRLGGRILSLPAQGGAVTDQNQRYDLGPTWYWPAMQPQMTSLIAQLGLSTFPQYSSGAVAIERFRFEPVRYAMGYDPEPASMRLVGGMQALVDALEGQLPNERLHLGSRVTAIRRDATGVRVEAVNDQGAQSAISASKVILALPPRLIAQTISFAPELPLEIRQTWTATPTWMAGQAKIIAVYEHAFWREAGLSGSAQSMVGPLAEIHDASALQGDPALFGFVGIGASGRRALGPRLPELAVAQLVRLFGEAAGNPKAVLFKDWADDPLTATAADAEPVSEHPAFGTPGELGPDWESVLFVAGTEAARSGGGYLEGALVAAEDAVK